MKVALLTDSHWGARNDNHQVLNYFIRFYDDVFFPKVQELKITRSVHLGDLVERRKQINFLSLAKMRKHYLEPVQDLGLETDVLLGNHDMYFKSTPEVNALDELLRGYNQIKTFSEPCVRQLDNTLVQYLPWIHEGNAHDSLYAIENTPAHVVFGHLEISGFDMFKGFPNHHGLKAEMFDRFHLVCSGHFHHASHGNVIHYLGSPYEMIWADYKDPRGFYIWDTDDLKLEFVPNPHRLFFRLVYDDTGKDISYIDGFIHHMQTNVDMYAGKFIKLIVKHKNNSYWYDAVVEAVYKVGAFEINIVEDSSGYLDSGEELTPEQLEVSDTLTLLHEHVKGMGLEDVGLQDELSRMLQQTYQRALESKVLPTA